jgi:hypothetical protein
MPGVAQGSEKGCGYTKVSSLSDSHRKSSSSPAPNDFGRLAANAVARGGHTVCAAMRETAGRNAPQVADVKAHVRKGDVDLRTIELDVGSQPSVDRAVAATKC